MTGILTSDIFILQITYETHLSFTPDEIPDYTIYSRRTPGQNVQQMSLYTHIKYEKNLLPEWETNISS